ncbi:MAG: alpha/beta fold hydrolase [Syntrophomonadaceae bacterium]|nr:alpha/beta fold hydrolase [Syntrophomonadaceae bacterium]
MINKDDSFSFLYNPRIVVPNSNQYWEKVELCHVDSLAGVKEVFCEVNCQLDPNIIDHFGTRFPAADAYLLHYARGWNSNRHEVPVLLVHGAGLDATSYTNLWDMGYTGLQQQLVSLGYRVFSVTFSHSHGDNFYQAMQLADAIDRVKQLTGAGTVDVVAHSKGGIAARIYLSNMSATAYRNDVRRFVTLGVPNLGTDFAFRNPSISYLIYTAGGNGVIAWDKLIYLTGTVDITPRSIYAGGGFPGQSQILYRWDDEYNLDVSQQDWWTTYYGGSGYVSHSQGIEAAIMTGGNLIAGLEKHGINADIELSVLAGESHLFAMIPLQTSIPGDGIVFRESALNTDAMVSGGANLKDKRVMTVNHIELLYHPRVARWVDRQLRNDD